jgi:TonB family protein
MSRRWLIAVSLVAHLAVAATLAVAGVGRFERLDPDHRRLTRFGELFQPEPAPSGGSKVPDVVTRVDAPAKRTPVKGPVQPTTPPPEIDQITTDPGTGTGEGPGSGGPDTTGACLEGCGAAPPAEPVCGNAALEAGEQCDDGNLVDGDRCSATCHIEPPPPVETKVITPNVLQALRISGQTQLHPDASTQNRMLRDGVSTTRVTVSLCIATDGGVASVKLLAPSRYNGYDAAIVAAVRDWRYQPYRVDGVAVRACSAVSFVYQIE